MASALKKKKKASKQKCSWSALLSNENSFLGRDMESMAWEVLSFFSTRQAELWSYIHTAGFLFYLCICNVLTATPQPQSVTNVKENSRHKYGNHILMGRKT